MAHIAVRNISKRFEATEALRDVSFAVDGGRVLALCGENGAGKSTLIRILAGAVRPDGGSIALDGEEVEIGDPHRAIELGIRTVHQELSLLGHLSVAENMLFGRMPHRGPAWLIDWPECYRRAGELLAGFRFDQVDPRARVDRLSVSGQQLVEIAKALAARPRILILDEPTSVLSVAETRLLFDRVRGLAAAGTTVIYISHRLEEVFEIADAIVVLKDGEVAMVADRQGASEETLIRAMVGRPLAAIHPPRDRTPGATVLAVRGLARPPAFEDVGFELRAGEIVGMFGLVGSGRTDVARAVFGAAPAVAGEIAVAGRPCAIASPRDGVAAGIAFVTEDRKRDGLALELSVLDNGALASMGRSARHGFLNRRRQEAMVGAKLDELQVRPRGTRRRVRQLSGGNQQKVVLAKWMLAEGVRVFIFDEPTRGVDIGTKVEIYRMIADLAKAGMAVLMISSEMPEILGMSDRIIVMRQGRIAVQLAREEADMETLFAHAAGVARGRA
jgi:ABC-type sugar transport system ATPase subunit